MRRILTFSALVFAMMFASAVAAGAQDDGYGGTPPVQTPPAEVGGDVVTPGTPATPANPAGPGTPATPATPANSTKPAAVVKGDVVTRPLAADVSRGGLPVTGGDLVGLTVLGLAAIGVGTALVATRRRNLRTV